MQQSIKQDQEKKAKLMSELKRTKEKSPSHKYTDGEEARKEHEEGRYKAGGHVPLKR
jgi:hypothetical protein